MLEVKNISKYYGETMAIENISFKAEKGQIVGLVGHNGSGKSTTMNIITNCLTPSGGDVLVDGISVTADPIGAKRKIGYLPEIPPVYPDMTVDEQLSFACALRSISGNAKKEQIEKACEGLNITGVRKRLIKNLSKGYRQRVGFASALVGNSDVLILDEPTVGLDPNQIIEIRNLIAKLGKNHTIILSSHILSEIEAVCKRVIILNRGQIIADDTAENLSKTLSNDHSVTVRITGSEADMLKALESVKGVKSVAPLGSLEKGSYDFTVTPEDGCDIRAGVFERITERGRTALSLSSNELSLEQIFLRLTSAANNDEARKMLGIEALEQPEEAAEAEVTEESEEDKE